MLDCKMSKILIPVCGFCSETTEGWVRRVKQHLIGGYRNATAWRKCPDHDEEIKAYMSKKKETEELFSEDDSEMDEEDIDGYKLNDGENEDEDLFSENDFDL